MTVTFVIPSMLERRLRDLASQQGCDLDTLIESALRRYLDDAAITDVTPAEVAATQEKLLGELTDLQPWNSESADDEAQ